MIFTLVKRLCVFIPLVLTAKPALAEYIFDVENACHLPVSLILSYKDARTGNWKTTLPIYLEPEMKRWETLKEENGHPILTNSSVYYYYAELFGNDAYTWSDKQGLKLRVKDRTLGFRKVIDKFGGNLIDFSCKDLKDAKTIFLHNDCDAEVSVGIRYERVNGKWESWYHTLLPGEQALTNVITRNRSISYYAESVDGTGLIWSGSKQNADPLIREYYGMDVVYKRTKLGDAKDQGGETGEQFMFVLSCDDHTAKWIQLASKTPVLNKRTELRIVYRDFRYAFVPVWWASILLIDYQEYPHATLVAVHPENPHFSSVYIDAGPAGHEDGKSKKLRVCPKYKQLCSQVRNAASIIDYPAYENFQSVFVDMSFNEVVGYMLEYTERVNSRRVKYNTFFMNCNSFVFTFMRRWLGFKDIKPRPYNPEKNIYLIGWKWIVPGV